MTFLLISQRAIPNSNYNLKDLTSHGRIDVVFRCILAATRQIATDPGHDIYCFLKGSTPHGWLTIHSDFVHEEDDEISLAARIQDHWSEVFTTGTLDQLIPQLDHPFVFLTETGTQTREFKGTIVLGAQNDLITEDLSGLPIGLEVSLGNRSLLASHAIIYSRQLLL